MTPEELAERDRTMSQFSMQLFGLFAAWWILISACCLLILISVIGG